MSNTERKQRKANKIKLVKEPLTKTPVEETRAGVEAAQKVKKNGERKTGKQLQAANIRDYNRAAVRATRLANQKRNIETKQRKVRENELRATEAKYVLAQQVITAYWENKGYFKNDKNVWEKL